MIIMYLFLKKMERNEENDDENQNGTIYKESIYSVLIA